jgi:hypothetical protein
MRLTGQFGNRLILAVDVQDGCPCTSAVAERIRSAIGD